MSLDQFVHVYPSLTPLSYLSFPSIGHNELIIKNHTQRTQGPRTSVSALPSATDRDMR